MTHKFFVLCILINPFRKISYTLTFMEQLRGGSLKLDYFNYLHLKCQQNTVGHFYSVTKFCF